MLSPTDQFPSAPRRVLVAGTSGPGKTTLAIAIASVLSIPHIEIDALYHGPDWTPRPTFAAEIAELVAQPEWVTEWQYHQVRSLLASAADLLVWLDLSRPRVMWQVTRRTVRRRLHEEMLWHNNVEPPLRTFFTDRDHIVRWAWRTYPKTAARVLATLDERPDLQVVHLTSHSTALDWTTGPLTAAARSV
jgi:adenylate kinase family enzyme